MGSGSRGCEGRWRTIPSLGLTGPGRDNPGPGKTREGRKEEQLCFLTGELYLFLWAAGPRCVHLCMCAQGTPGLSPDLQAGCGERKPTDVPLNGGSGDRVF